MTLFSEVSSPAPATATRHWMQVAEETVLYSHQVAIAVSAPSVDNEVEHHKICLVEYNQDLVIPVPWFVAGMRLNFGFQVEQVLAEVVNALMPTVFLRHDQINPLQRMVSDHQKAVIHPFVVIVDHNTFEDMRDYREYAPLQLVTTCMQQPKPKQVEPYIRRALIH